MEKQTYLPKPLVDPTISASPSKTRLLTRIAAIVALVFLFWNVRFGSGSVRTAPPLGLPDKVQRRWGQYSPWFPAGDYPSPPPGCQVNQVNILHRHGARYPVKGDRYDVSIKRLTTADKFLDSRLDFLREFQYDLGEDVLTAFGAAQSFESGQATFHRYSHLIDAKSMPFVRASGEDRVISSAANWTVGFAAASSQRYNPRVDVILPESQNDTLKDDCPLSGEGKKEKDAWLNTYAPPIAKRLKKAAPGAKIANKDIFNLMAMCPFETIATQKPSDFCRLFKKKEFLEFEYHGDVEKYYKTGYGEPLGPVQGVGYVNELLARLLGRPVIDHTQHNSSYPFPLSRPMYADFTHENLMVAVYSAIGLFNITDHPLHTKKMDKNRTWVASKMVPFSARMVVERLACSNGDYGGGDKETEHVRVLVNDALQPLKFCGATTHGLCTLDAFVESQGYARRSGDGDFEKCYP